MRSQYSITRFPWRNWVALLFLEILQLSIYFGVNPIYFEIEFIIGHIISNLTAENWLEQSNCNLNSIFLNFECHWYLNVNHLIVMLYINYFTIFLQIIDVVNFYYKIRSSFCQGLLLTSHTYTNNHPTTLAFCKKICKLICDFSIFLYKTIFSLIIR